MGPRCKLKKTNNVFNYLFEICAKNFKKKEVQEQLPKNNTISRALFTWEELVVPSLEIIYSN
jgi:hypothetical protein